MARRDRCSMYLSQTGTPCLNQAKFMWERYPKHQGRHSLIENRDRPVGSRDPRPVCVECRNGHARANGGVEIGRWAEI